MSCASDVKDLARRAKRLVRSCWREIPDDLAAEISSRTGVSATNTRDVSLPFDRRDAEDLRRQFRRQQETSQCSGEESLLDACKRCFASLFTDRSIHYRIDRVRSLQGRLSIGDEDGAFRPRVIGRDVHRHRSGFRMSCSSPAPTAW